MRNSKTTLSELTARYRAVLLKCFMLNAAVWAGICVSGPAMAADGASLDPISAAIAAGETDIKLSVDVSDGIGHTIASGSNLTIDFGGTTYTAATVPVGSQSTETNMFQLLKDSDITLKNGTLAVDKANLTKSDFEMLIQNYANLTLDNMVLDGSNLIDENGATVYTLSSNNGTTIVNGGKIIAATNNGVALDMYHWSTVGYGDVVVKLNGTDINGKIFLWNDSDPVSDGQLNLTAEGGKWTAAATTKNGGNLFNKGFVTLKDVEISGNSANLGGAIYNQGVLSITGGSFKDNVSVKGANGNGIGGAIYNSGTVSIDGTTFTGNGNFDISKATLADTETHSGGAIYNVAGSSLTIANATFTENKAWLGGAINNSGVSDGTSSLIITDSSFYRNEAWSNGGALRNQNYAKLNVSSTAGKTSVFEGNKSSNGGALWNGENGEITIDSVSFIKNIAFGDGSSANGLGQGGAIVNRGVMTLSGENKFEGNEASQIGGAIYNLLGGELILSGTNTFTGNKAAGVANDIHNKGTLKISSGTTTIDGGITGDGTLTVASGATLDIGTTTVQQGTIDVQSGSTLAMTLNATTDHGQLVAANYTVDGAIDLTVSTAGDYQLFVGSQTDLTGQISKSDLYTFTAKDNETVTVALKSVDAIAADTGLSDETAGTLASVIAADPTNEIAADISLAAQQTLAAAANGTPEQKAAAQALVTEELGKLNQESAGARQSTAMATQRQTAKLADMRINGPKGRSGGDVKTAYGLWIQGLYNKTKLDHQFHGYTRGFALGADTVINDAWTVGLGYSYNDSDINLSDRKLTVDTNTVFAYGQYKPSKWFVNGLLSYSWSDYTEKAVSFGKAIESSYDVDTYGANLMTGYDLAGGLTPEMGLRYLHIASDDYVNVAGSLISADDDDVLTGVVGLRYAPTFKSSKRTTFQPEVRAALTYDLISDNGHAVVAGNGVSYSVDSKRLARFGTEFGAGLKMTHGNVDVSVSYGLDVRRDYTSHTGTANLKYHF